MKNKFLLFISILLLGFASTPGAWGQISVNLTAASGNWTVPAGVTNVQVQMWGGGGGGGGAVFSASTDSGGGGGGGGGGYTVTDLTVTPETIIAYTVGSAGTAGTTSGANGVNGGNTTFAGATTAIGGTGGGGTTTPGVAGIGGAGGGGLYSGGTGGTGTASTSGGVGSSGGGGGAAASSGVGTSASANTGGSGATGTPNGGNGANGGVSGNGTGAAGTVPGGGGAGGDAHNSTTGRAGGAGAAGEINLVYTPVATALEVVLPGQTGGAGAVSGTPTLEGPGQTFTVKIYAVDVNGFLVTNSTQPTVTFSSTDPNAIFTPSSITLVKGTNSVSVTMEAIGDQTIEATNTVIPIGGVSSSFAVGTYVWTSTGTAPPVDGSGTWKAGGTPADWLPNGAGTAVDWPAGASATIGSGNGSAGTITLSSTPAMQDIYFDLPSGYYLTASTIKLTGTATSPSIFSVASGVTATVGYSGAAATSSSEKITDNAAPNTLEVSGPGTLQMYSTIGDANSYSGGTILTNAATLSIDQDNDLGSGTITFDGATLTTSNGTAVSLNNSVTLNGNTANTLGETSVGTGNLDFTGYWTIVGQSATLTVSNITGEIDGQINDGGNGYGLTVTGSGTLLLDGPNVYTGATIVSSGASLGGTGSMAGTVTWQTGAGASFVEGSPFSAGVVIMNNNAVTVNVSGGTPLGAGTYPLMYYNASGSTGSFDTVDAPTIIGAGLAAYSTATITVNSGEVALVVTTTVPPSAAFSGLSSTTIVYGTASVNLSGTVSGPGPTYPANGETVTATINGHTVNGTISGSSGAFTIDYNAASLATDSVSGSPYTITYSYAGDADLYATNDSSTALMVTKATPSLIVGNSPVTYNGSPQAATVNASVAGSVSSLMYNGSATVPSAPGTYAVTANFAPSDSTDYNSLTGASAGSFVIQSSSAPIMISGVKVSGTTLTFSAANGTANGTYILLESTNPALPLSDWTPVFTNTFDANGNINLSTNVVNLANQINFYCIQVP